MDVGYHHFRKPPPGLTKEPSNIFTPPRGIHHKEILEQLAKLLGKFANSLDGFGEEVNAEHARNLRRKMIPKIPPGLLAGLRKR